jgi:hypothetical protein
MRLKKIVNQVVAMVGVIGMCLSGTSALQVYADDTMPTTDTVLTPDESSEEDLNETVSDDTTEIEDTATSDNTEDTDVTTNDNSDKNTEEDFSLKEDISDSDAATTNTNVTQEESIGINAASCKDIPLGDNADPIGEILANENGEAYTYDNAVNIPMLLRADVPNIETIYSPIDLNESGSVSASELKLAEESIIAEAKVEAADETKTSYTATITTGWKPESNTKDWAYFTSTDGTPSIHVPLWINNALKIGSTGLNYWTFVVNYNKQNYMAFCAEGNNASPVDRSTNSGGLYIVNNAELRKILYYGYNGPQNVLTEYGLSDSQQRILMSDLVSKAYSGTTTAEYCRDNNTGTLKNELTNYYNNWVDSYYKAIIKKQDPKDFAYEAYVVKQPGIQAKSWKDNSTMENVQTVAFGAYAYESPKTGEATKKLSDSINLQYKIDITKTDTAGKPLSGVKFKVTVKLSDTDSEVKEYITDSNGKINTTMYVTRSFTTKEYKEKYIENYNKLSSDYQSLYATYTKPSGSSTAASIAEASVQKQAQAELDNWKKSMNTAHTVTWVEVATQDGYKLDSTEHSETKNSGDTITGSVVNETYGKSTSSTGKGEFTTTVNVDIDKLDSDTQDKITGGQFEVWVSNYKSYDPDNPEKAAEIYDKADVISAKDGKLTLSVSMQANKDYTSGDIPYVDNYDSLSASNQALYRDYYHSYDAAKAQADKVVKDAIAKGQSDFENATRYVKIIETQTPTRYIIIENDTTKIDELGDGVSVFKVTNGKATGIILNQGLASIYVLKTESDRSTPIANVKLQLSTKDGNVIDTWTTEDSTEPHKIDGLDRETEYILTEISPNTDYVTPTKKSYTIKTSDSGYSTPTYYTLVNYKVEVSKQDLTPNPVIGATLQVLDSTGTVVDEWQTTKNKHQVQNLVEGNTYILHEEKAPDGYIIAKDVEFTVASEQDQVVEMTDTMTFADKQGADSKTLAGSQLNVIDKETNEVVDAWTSGLKIVDITDEQAKTLQEKGNITIKTDDAEYVISSRTENVSKKDMSTVDTYGVRKTQGTTVSYYDIYLDGTEAAHAVRNLQQGKEYTLHEVKAPKGYTITADMNFKPEETENIVVNMLDTAVYVGKYTGEFDLLSGAKMQVVNKETNEIVDSWTTGQQLVNLTDEQTEQLWNTETVTFTKQETIDGETKDVTYTIEPSYSTINEEGTVSTYSLDTEHIGAIRNNYSIEDSEVINTEEPDTDSEDTSFTGYIMRVIHSWSVFSDNSALNEAYVPNVFEMEGASGELSAELQEDLVALNASREERAICTLKKYYDDVTEYHLMTIDGKEAAHMVNNLSTSANYVVQELEAPAGYTIAEDTDVIPSDNADTWTDVVDTQVTVRKVDISDEEIPGAKMEVTDENGNVVDSWISTTEPHYIKNIAGGKKYTLTETLAPLGYNKASEVQFTVENGEVSKQLTMVDTVSRISKEDENGNLVKGARLQVLDDKGNEVDSWVSGQHMIDMKDEMLKELKDTGIYVVSAANAVVKYDDTTLNSCEEYLHTAVQKVLSGGDTSLTESDSEENSDTETTEENADKPKELNASQNVHAAYELLPYDAETLQAKVSAASEKVLALSKNPDENLAEDIVAELMTELKADANTFNATNEENADFSQVYIEKVSNSDNAYLLVKVAKDGQATFIDINEYGNETTHRMSNLEVGKTYTLRELDSPAHYNTSVDITFVADASNDIVVTMLDTFVLEGENTSVFMNNPIVFAGIGAFVILVLGLFVLLKKKQSKKVNLPDSFTL